MTHDITATLRRALTIGALTLAAAGSVAWAAPETASAADLISRFEVDRSTAQAGAHPDTTVDIDFAADDRGVPGEPDPLEEMRNLQVDLPTGLIGDPTATPTCTDAELLRKVPDPATGQNFDGCPAASQVGVVEYRQQTHVPLSNTQTGPDGVSRSVFPVYNMVRRSKDVARLAFTVQGTAVVPIELRVRDEGDFGVRADVSNLPTTFVLLGTRLDLWGVPNDPSHDTLRRNCLNEYGAGSTGTCPTTEPRVPFMVNPTRCDASRPASIVADSYQNPGVLSQRSTAPLETTGCGGLPFDPTVTVEPQSTVAGQPAGYDFDVRVPQNADPDGQTAAHVKDVTVTLPEGTAISPPSADGLSACSDADLRLGSRDAPQCPAGSKIGSATIDTPLLDGPLEGAAYLGEQRSGDPESGEMYRLFLAVEGHGVSVKLRGNLRVDSKTGQVTATFRQNPEVPFERLLVQLKGGDRAPLVNPPTCGDKTARATLTSWDGQSRDVSNAFAIDQGCNTSGFSPGFTAGTVNPFAGGHSPFTMSVFRNDGDQDLSKIKLDLPPGLLGALGSVPVCADAQAAAGTCGAETRLGSTRVGVGSGAKPFSLPGTVSLAGPYKGAPFSLSIAVPAKAGPLDLGLVVVRSPLLVDAKSATVSAPVDDLPKIVGGVPLHYRSINVTLDRPGFMFNATNCTATTINATLTGSGGAVASPSSRYQPQGCDKLVLNPTLKMTYSGKADLAKGKNPKLTADLGQTFGQAGLKKVAVTLPLLSSLKPENAKALCTPAQAATRACPEASIVGRASATTPALHGSLTGPVYFVEGTRVTASGRIAKTLPKLWLKLAGDGVPLDLWADSSIDNKTKRLIATFHDIPDAPIANFKLEIDGGKNGILTATADPCTATRTATAQFDGQNGGRTIRNIAIAVPECGTRAAVAATTAGVAVRFSGIGAGKLAVSGKGIKTTRKTIKRAGLATVVAPLTAEAKAQLAAGKSVKVTVTATYDPSGTGKTVKTTGKVTIKPAKSAKSSR